jgi:type II secretory ATPase GspE/PulE/Tfp pilus assembly ATPase PilB-like protein
MSMNTGEFRLGELLVREGLVSESQLSEALQWQREQQSYVPLGQVLVRRKMLTPRQLKLMLDRSGKRPKLGELLIRSRTISHEQLDHALGQQKKIGGPLGQVLIKLGYMTDDKLRQALSVQLDIPFLDLDNVILDRELTRYINRSYARRHWLLPVARVGDALTVCMDDPTDQQAIEELGQSTGLAVTLVTSSREAIRRAFARLYEEARSSNDTIGIVIGEQVEATKSKYVDDYHRSLQSKAADVVVRKLLAIAIERRASDIHLETLADRLQIRFRIDGLLESVDLGDLEEKCHDSGREIVSRLKVLGKLDIAERRRPQDGSFRVKVDRPDGTTDVDLRLSVVPGHYGESVVVRVLDRKNAPTSFEQLQLPRAIADKLRQLFQRTGGMLLVTGPTGSGKSTTIYASLMTLYRPRIRVLTAEDPIEYVYDQFSQSEVNERIGNTFASYLRAFLRHDPEVIMVGEIRDEETAEMAFRAAQTGHLLLSTLHTTTAIDAVPRLLDLKVDANTLASALIGVVGQRLVRQVCTACRVEYTPSPDLIREFFDGAPDTLTFYKGTGCSECNLTGYRGRLTVVELWVPSEEDIVLINKNAPLNQIRASAQSSTLSMADCAVARLHERRTNLEELTRVLPYSVIYEIRQNYSRRQKVPASN